MGNAVTPIEFSIIRATKTTHDIAMVSIIHMLARQTHCSRHNALNIKISRCKGWNDVSWQECTHNASKFGSSLCIVDHNAIAIPLPSDIWMTANPLAKLGFTQIIPTRIQKI